MGFTAPTNPIVWQPAALLNEITGALREREQMVDGVADTAVVSAGDNVQTASLWASWQQACEDLADEAIWVEDKDYTGEATIPVLTWANVKTLAGIPDGFRRALTKPADWTDYDDAAFVAAGYGQVQVGDIQGGPWLFADLQAVLKVLVATKPGGLSTYEPGGVNFSWYATFVSDVMNCEEIKTACEGEWAAGGGHGSYVMSMHDWAFVGRRTVSLEKRLRGVEFTGGSLWNGVDRSCDWYGFAEEAVGWEVFDANGEGLVEDKWGLWAGAGSPENTVNPQSPYCPDVAVDAPLPVWVDCPDQDGHEHWRGFSVTSYECVVRWNVLGGFTYV